MEAWLSNKMLMSELQILTHAPLTLESRLGLKERAFVRILQSCSTCSPASAASFDESRGRTNSLDEIADFLQPGFYPISFFSSAFPVFHLISSYINARGA